VNEDEPFSQDVQTGLDQYYGWTDGSDLGGRLQSTRDVIGSYIEAQDGDIGHVEDFIIDDTDWAVRYMVVDTKDWWPGKKVLVSPRWIQSLKWADKKVHIDLTRAQVESSPEYEADQMPGRDTKKGFTVITAAPAIGKAMTSPVEVLSSSRTLWVRDFPFGS
jgi:hypothetical protein